MPNQDSNPDSILTNKPNNRLRNIGIVMLLTFLSKVFGFVRDLTLAYYYGASNVSDAYLISLTIPEFVFSLVIQAIAVGFIPIFVEIIHSDGEREAESFTNQVLTILYICGVVVLLFLNVFPRGIVSVFASGFDADTMSLAASFVRITAIALLFKGTVSVLSAYCQANGEFARPAAVGMPLDLIIILSIIISAHFDPRILAYGTVVGFASQVFIVFPFCKKRGYQFRLSLQLNNPHIKKMIALFLPVVIGVGANQINILVDRTLASRIAIGGISALNYANKIDNIMENVIVMSIAGVMYPIFATLATKKDYDSLKANLLTTFDEVMLLMIPITVGAIIFSEPIISLLFTRGAFDMHASTMTARAMAGYSIGMLGVSFRAILTRVFYSLQDIKTPVINSAIAVGINIVLNLVLSRYLGISGLAIASSIASIVCSFLMLLQLKKRIGLALKTVLSHGGMMLVAASIMVAVCLLSYHALVNHLHFSAALIISILIGLVFYGAEALIIKMPGTTGILSMIKKKHD